MTRAALVRAEGHRDVPAVLGRQVPSQQPRCVSAVVGVPERLLLGHLAQAEMAVLTAVASAMLALVL